MKFVMNEPNLRRDFQAVSHLGQRFFGHFAFWPETFKPKYLGQIYCKSDIWAKDFFSKIFLAQVFLAQHHFHCKFGPNVLGPNVTGPKVKHLIFNRNFFSKFEF